MDAPDWELALCARTRPPMRGFWTSEDAAEREQARLACFSCPIRRACADWAIATLSIDNHHPDPTVWGGMSAAMRRQRRLAWLAEHRDRRWRAEAG